MSADNQGSTLEEKGDYAGARKAYERELANDEKALGPNHPNAATDLSYLGAVLRAGGEFVRAKHMLERALSIDEKALGPDHPDTVMDRRNLELLLRDMEDKRVVL